MGNEKEPLWELRGITKIFPGVKALDGIDMKIYPGEVHGLLGENGSGKSTLIKCLAGIYSPTTGLIIYKGKSVSINNPEAAGKFGVATIFQELSLVPTLTVAENIFVGHLPKKGIIVDWKSLRKMSTEILKELKIEINPNSVVGTLSVAQQQMVEIAKAVSKNTDLLIMDEPTAALGMEDIENLHELTRSLINKGCAVIYISHRMDEVRKIVDKVTILKDGKLAGRIDSGDIDLNRIVRMMIGEDVKDHFPKERNILDKVLYRAEGIRTDNGVNGISLEIRKGEVLGLAGVIGSGRTEIARALFGIDRIREGHVGDGNGAKSPRHAIRNGIALITENKKADGLFMNFNATKNITISALKKVKKRGILNLKREREVCNHYIGKLNLPHTARYVSIGNLSGGNQQKAIICRWLFCDADFFILDEPTQGIDIGAKVEVYNLINELTRRGKSILLISSDFPELLAMSDRIAVIHDGQIVYTDLAENMTLQSLMESVISKESANYVKKETE